MVLFGERFGYGKQGSVGQRGNVEYGGPSYDFLQSVLNLFDPPAQLNLLPGWATEQSRQRFSSHLQLFGIRFFFFRRLGSKLGILRIRSMNLAISSCAGSYTACVHDVAVGNFDICIADLWLTPNRHRLAWFLPTIRPLGCLACPRL